MKSGEDNDINVNVTLYIIICSRESTDLNPWIRHMITPRMAFHDVSGWIPTKSSHGAVFRPSHREVMLTVCPAVQCAAKAREIHVENFGYAKVGVTRRKGQVQNASFLVRQRVQMNPASCVVYVSFAVVFSSINSIFICADPPRYSKRHLYH